MRKHRPRRKRKPLPKSDDDQKWDAARLRAAALADPAPELAVVLQHARAGAAALRGDRPPSSRPRRPLGLGRLISPALLQSEELLGHAGALFDWRGHQYPEDFFLSSILPRARAGQLVIDVGAHVGQFAVEIARHGAGLRGVSFEPMPAACSQLKRNLRRAIGPDFRKRMTVHCAGVSDSDGSIRLPGTALTGDTSNRDDDLSRRSTSFKLAHQAPLEPTTAGDVAVPVLTLDGLESKGELEGEVLLLKIDTQGFEMRVLRGASRLLSQRRVHLLMVEMSNYLLKKAGGSALGLMRLLDEMGYACTHLSFWSKWRNSPVWFKPLRTSLLPLLHGRHSLPFEEVASTLQHLPPLNSTGWTDLLCW